MLQEILEARENRAVLRDSVAEGRYITISLSLNIPGYPKSNKLIHSVFSEIVCSLLDYLLASRISFSNDLSINKEDAAGDFFITPILSTDLSGREVKNLMEQFEQEHQLSRLIDVDVFDENAMPISSGKEKKCILCTNSAISCMREQRHSMDDIRDFIKNQFEDYINSLRKNRIKKKMVSYATRALLYEVSVSPKPGLVDRISSGSHTDMDFFSFLNSSSALAIYWSEIAELAYNWDGKEHEKTLKNLRCLGIEMEREMLDSTQGVNTQKGAIFILGFIVFASSYLLYKFEEIKENPLREIIAFFNKDLVDKELLSSSEKSSHGEEVFSTYGRKLGGGIRQEMEQALPIVFNIALPYLNSFKDSNSDGSLVNDRLLRTLLLIMSENDDTNILYRSNLNVLEAIKMKSLECFNSEEDLLFGKYINLLDFCKEHNVSPGGSADMLSATYFIYLIQKERI